MTRKPEPRMWSESLYNHKARYGIYGFIVMLALFTVVSNDEQILRNVETGNYDVRARDNVLLPFANSDTAFIAARLLAFALFVPIGYAVLVAVARWHYNNHGVSLE